jgi:16S rRNA (uracil1498-N3)-methyltransferase
MVRAQPTPALFRSAAHALVPRSFVFGGQTVELPEATHRHFQKVLRLRAGESVTVTDGNGTWQATRVPSNFVAVGALEADGEAVRVQRPAQRVAIGVALPKGEKPELIVQKLTELGVDEIVFFPGDHSVAQWSDDKVRKNFDRLHLVAIEALQQSRGLFLPVLRWADSLATLASGNTRITEPEGSGLGLGSGSDLASDVAVFRADAGGVQPQLRSRQIVVVGPEGGWSPTERQIGTAISLAPTILRAETAAVVAAAFWVGMRSNHVAQSPER